MTVTSPRRGLSEQATDAPLIRPVGCCGCPRSEPALAKWRLRRSGTSSAYTGFLAELLLAECDD